MMCPMESSLWESCLYSVLQSAVYEDQRPKWLYVGLCKISVLSTKINVLSTKSSVLSIKPSVLSTKPNAPSTKPNVLSN